MELVGELFGESFDSEYSKLVEAAQEYDEALTDYESAIETYQAVFSNFKEGQATPEEMKNAMDNFAYADDNLLDAVVNVELTAEDVQRTSVYNSDFSVVEMATEHSLAAQKIEETTEHFEPSGDDFIKSLEELQDIDNMIDTSRRVMEQHDEYLEETLDYSWEDAMEKAGDYDSKELDRLIDGVMMSEKRDEIIKESPNDSYIGGVRSETGTEDLDAKREEVLGPNSDLKEKRDNVLGLDEKTLEKARKKVRDSKPRYIH